jgi:hypothetical protein
MFQHKVEKQCIQKAGELQNVHKKVPEHPSVVAQFQMSLEASVN